MDHKDHVTLLRKGIPGTGGVWADLGSGRGAFTLALAELIGPGGSIYSIDQDRGALKRQKDLFRTTYPDVAVHFQAADFTRAMTLPGLDGIVMANSLHFVAQKEQLLKSLRQYLRPGGHFILVEYDTDRGNPWVPRPLSYETWETLARRCGFGHTEKLAAVPSRFLGQIFSALSY